MENPGFDTLVSHNGLATLLQRINSKMEDLQIMQEGIELNRNAIALAARRLDLQHQLLQKMLKEMDHLVNELRVVAHPVTKDGTS